VNSQSGACRYSTDSTQSSLESALIMEKGVESLLEQTGILKKEIRQLQVSDRKVLR
jgi:hypothetical protein